MTPPASANGCSITDSSASLVELRNVTLVFGTKLVLDNISLRINRRERFVLVGQSGAGKTTILRLILGILTPTAGSVFLQQCDVAKMSRWALQRVRSHVGMVYQDAALLSSSTVYENLALPLQELTTKTAGEIDRIVNEKLDLVEMAGEGKTMPAELSGGMRKRVGLARALVMDPELILFDEPTAGLDPVMSAVIDELIISTTERTKATSIVVTHLMDSAFRVATRLAMLHQGRIIEDSAPERFKQSTNPVVRQFLRGETMGPILQSRYHMLSAAECLDSC